MPSHSGRLDEAVEAETECPGESGVTWRGWRRFACAVTEHQWQPVGPMRGEPQHPDDLFGPIRYRCARCDEETLF